MRLSAWRFCCVVLEKRHFKNLRAAHVDDPHGGCGAHSGPLTQGSPHVFIQGRPLVREKYLPPCGEQPDHRPAFHCHVGGRGGSAISRPRPKSGVQSASCHPCPLVFGKDDGLGGTL